MGKPRPEMRWLAGMFGVVTIADVLQLLYKRAVDPSGSSAAAGT